MKRPGAASDGALGIGRLLPADALRHGAAHGEMHCLDRRHFSDLSAASISPRIPSAAPLPRPPFLVLGPDLRTDLPERRTAPDKPECAIQQEPLHFGPVPERMSHAVEQLWERVSLTWTWKRSGRNFHLQAAARTLLSAMLQEPLIGDPGDIAG